MNEKSLMSQNATSERMNATSQRILEALSSPRSIQQLQEQTQLPPRTLRYHLAILRQQNLIDERHTFSDRRRKIIFINNGSEESKKRLKFDVNPLALSDSGSVRSALALPECSAW